MGWCCRRWSRACTGTAGHYTLPSSPTEVNLTPFFLYLRNDVLRLKPMGELAAHAERAVDDGCKASCVDWYGNARPIFIGERVFALLGYELVEGRVSNERIVERRRTSFAPVAGVSD